MSTLRQLSFKDFQSLHDTEITLDPGLNVIVGPSNLGKSAAIRALRALVRNAPAPGLIREGKKEFRIGAVFDDGLVETLTKGKNINQYEIHLADGKSWVNAKSGVKAPDEVTDLWALPAPDGRELAFASQHDAPFLLNEPASAVAKVLGDLTNASMLMEAVQKANKLRKGALDDVKARSREADEAREEILTHTGLSARGRALEAAREAYRAAQDRVAEWQKLVQLSDAFNNFEQERKLNAEILSKNVSLQSLLDKAVVAVDKVSELHKLAEDRNGLSDNAAGMKIKIKDINDKLSKTEEQIKALLEEAGVCPLCGSTTC